MNKNPFLPLIGIIVLMTGCTLSPEYKRPEAPITADWPKGAAYSETRAMIGAPMPSELRWQEFFADENLQMIIETALKNNRDLRLSALNVQRARAIYGIQRSELLPSVNATGRWNRERTPADLSSSGTATLSEKYNVNLGISSWEIDFFGRIQSLRDRTLEEYLATEQAHRSAQILLVSSVANAYLALAADREHLKIAKSTLEAQKTAYHLIQKRFELGLSSELDLRQAQTQVDAALGDIGRFTQIAAQDENALNLLAGSPIPISNEILPKDLTGVKPPREISPGMSSDVLLSRPDILAAEHRLKSANANIGAARAAFFPRIALTAAFGTASSELSGLFKTGSDAWNFTPQGLMPIFDARLWSAYDATKVEKEIALAQYEKAIQTSFRETADALAIHGTMQSQLSAQQSLRDAVAETHRLSNVRYNKGIDSYLGVLDAQRSLYAAEHGLVAIRLAQMVNQVQLYSLLGGGTE